MLILNKQNKEKLKIVFLATIGFGLLAHAFAYFNLEYSHDSLMVVSQDDNWQVSLGRFLQPLYIYFRGRINAPWLIGTLSLAFLSIAVWFMLDLFNIWKKSYVVALCGIFATNVTLICLNATYLPWVDMFMLSLLFAVVSAWITFRYRFGFLPGAILLFVSMAIYQSYLAVFVTLAMLYAIYCILNYRGMKETLRLTLHAVVCGAISAILYNVC